MELPPLCSTSAIAEQWWAPPRRQHNGTGAGAAAEITGTKNGARIRNRIELAVSLRICENGQQRGYNTDPLLQSPRLPNRLQLPGTTRKALSALAVSKLDAECCWLTI